MLIIRSNKKRSYSKCKILSATCCR